MGAGECECERACRRRVGEHCRCVHAGVTSGATSHEEGDRALKHIGADIREICAKKMRSAKVYHSGGDEFQILALCNEDEGTFRTRVQKVAKDLSMKVEHEKSGVKCYLRIGAVCRMGATFKEADELEHKVKAAIMEKRGKPANSREQVYDTEPAERYLVEE